MGAADPYEVRLEVSGPTAMWTRADTGDVPASYPAPTYGAVKGIFESILLSDWAEVVPVKVEICKPLQFHVYNTNYGGPLRKSKLLKNGASYQLLATVLTNVCYRLYARLDCVPATYSRRGDAERDRQDIGTTNGAHAYQERFNRRLKKGQMHYMPCLGWKEFVPDYVGEFRAETHVCEGISMVIPSMLKTCFPDGRNSQWKPAFYKPDDSVTIDKGVLVYA
jgi:CRISPR-associated protein Cas5d